MARSATRSRCLQRFHDEGCKSGDWFSQTAHNSLAERESLLLEFKCVCFWGCRGTTDFLGGQRRAVQAHHRSSRSRHPKNPSPRCLLELGTELIFC